jgi:undecaprenyl-diphosphatase
MDWIQLLTPKIEHWGWWSYWIILLVATLESTAFIGLIIPGTTIIIAVGFLASLHLIDVGDVIWFTAFGGIIGDAVSYYLGKKGINFFTIDSRFFKTSYLEQGKKFFQAHGAKSVLLARFIGPFRPIIPFVAGLIQMPKRKFFLLNIVGGFASATFYVFFGYFFGKTWYRYHNLFGRGSGIVIIVFSVLFVGYWLRKKLFEKK